MRRRTVLSGLALLLAGAGSAVARTIRDAKQRNDLVRDALQRQGDNGRTPRQVDHWAYPASGAISLRDMIAALRKDGFSAGPSQTGNGVTFGHVVAVHDAAFDELTFGMERFCGEHNWTYDGWETVVVRKGTSG